MTVERAPRGPRRGSQLHADVLTGAIIRGLRAKQGWSQGQLAERIARFGLPWVTATVSRLERGDRVLTLHEAIYVAAALGCSIDELIEGAR